MALSCSGGRSSKRGHMEALPVCGKACSVSC